jgi:hypothetical protein
MTAAKIYKGGGGFGAGRSGSGSRGSGSRGAARGMAFNTMSLNGQNVGYAPGTGSGDRSWVDSPPIIYKCKQIGSYYVECVYDITKLTPEQTIYIIHNYQNKQQTTKYDLCESLEQSTEVTYKSVEEVVYYKNSLPVKTGILNYKTTDMFLNGSINASDITTAENDIKKYSIYIDCSEITRHTYSSDFGTTVIAIRDPSQFRKGDTIYILDNDELDAMHNSVHDVESVKWGKLKEYTVDSYNEAEGLRAHKTKGTNEEITIGKDELTTDNTKINKYSLYVTTIKQHIQTFNNSNYGEGKFKELFKNSKVTIRVPKERNLFGFNKNPFDLKPGEILYLVKNAENDSSDTSKFFSFKSKYKQDQEFKKCYKKQFYVIGGNNKYFFINLGQNLNNNKQNFMTLEPSQITTDENNLKEWSLYVDKIDAPGVSKEVLNDNLAAIDRDVTPVVTPVAPSGGRRSRKRRSRRSRKSKKSRRPRKSRR